MEAILARPGRLLIGEVVAAIPLSQSRVRGYPPFSPGLFRPLNGTCENPSPSVSPYFTFLTSFNSWRSGILFSGEDEAEGHWEALFFKMNSSSPSLWRMEHEKVLKCGGVRGWIV